jgi:hypothetical protein
MQTSDADGGAGEIALAAVGALREVADSRVSDSRGVSNQPEQHKSALFGFRVTLPLALGMWAALAGILWAVTR